MLLSVNYHCLFRGTSVLWHVSSWECAKLLQTDDEVFGTALLFNKNQLWLLDDLINALKSKLLIPSTMLEKKLPKHHSEADGDREISAKREQRSFGRIVCTFIHFQYTKTWNCNITQKAKVKDKLFDKSKLENDTKNGDTVDDGGDFKYDWIIRKLYARLVYTPFVSFPNYV